ncbi:MAG TPA: IPT/TIG domain-containing protein, partial [Clostridia bacterium]|nr:IPT/TIG domain-containing protein [Clostridia bacterium]
FTYMKPSTLPVITSMSPDSGSVDGGTVVTITGSGFKRDNLEVYFGSEKVTAPDFINATQIRVTVPKYPYPLPIGEDKLTVPVMVVNYDGGTAVRDGEDGFTYKIPSSHPVISGLRRPVTEEPVNSGSSAGGDEIIIEGLDFRRETVNSTPPDVYFNGVKAEVKWPEDNNTLIAEKLVVIVPASNVSGPVDIVLVNYDAGSCTYKGFSYTMSRPVISSITPSVVSNLGDVNVEIKGGGFRKGNLESLFLLNDGTQEQIRRHTDDPRDAADGIGTIVAFGDELTGDKRKIDTIVGPFYTVIGDLKFEFVRIDEGNGTIRVRYAATDAVVMRQLRDAGGDIVSRPMEIDLPIGSSHMFILNHSADLGNPKSFDEGILVETTPSLITVTRRIAPYASVNSLETKVTATAPPIDTEGSRRIHVINDDGGKASVNINVISPDSKPTITRIDPVNHGLLDNVVESYNPDNRELYTELYTYVPVDGGAFLTITGSDFRRNVKVYMEDKLLEIVSKSPNDDQLVVKVPPGTQEDIDRPYRIIVLNEDGGMADSSQLEQPYYVEYQASSLAPVVETIIPDKSSNGAANEILITGYGFDFGVVVSLDGIQCTTVRDDDKPSEILRFEIPVDIRPGPKLVMVQNPDYGYCEVPNGITIISSPSIDVVLDSEGQILDPVIFSVEGGEKIALLGTEFMEGAKVILGGVLKPKSDLEQGETGIECLGPDNTVMVVVGGVQASDAVFQGNDTITFTTPKLTSSDTSIIVINADGGVSNVIGASYQKPQPDKPQGIEIDVVDGDTIRLEWDKVADAIYYELHVSVKYDDEDRIPYRYFASVTPAETGKNRVIYFVEDLSPSTLYSFKIRAVNNYTMSDFAPATKYVETDDTIRSTGYQGTEEFQNMLKEDKIVVKGEELVYTAGENSMSSGVIADFDKQQYYGLSTVKSVELNYRQIIRHPEIKVRIKDKDAELNMTAGNLAVSEAVGIEGLLQQDTMIKVSINRNLGARGDDIRINLPKGYKFITNPFGIDMSIQVEKNAAYIKSLKGEAELTISYDGAKGNQFAGGVYILCYDNFTKKLEIIDTQRLSGALKAKISKSGAYAIIGKMTK